MRRGQPCEAAIGGWRRRAGDEQQRHTPGDDENDDDDPSGHVSFARDCTGSARQAPLDAAPARVAHFLPIRFAMTNTDPEMVKVGPSVAFQCPKCHAEDPKEIVESNPSTDRWFECPSCGHRWNVSPIADSN
jgi:DNA-directed RNA polymerase subunit M/transcription elongation factor TFIIS